MKKINSYFLITRKKIPVYLKYYIYRNSKQGKLPSEYQQVEYIESTGTQYINTGVIGKSGIEVYADILYTSIPDDITFIGARNSDIRIYPLHFYLENWAIGYGNYYRSSVSITQDVKYSIYSKLYTGEQLLIVDNNTVYSNTINQEYNTNYNLFVFALNYDGTAKFYASGRVYSLYIYENGVLTREFVPCYRKSDNEIGLYDLVSNTFFTNAGKGVFLKGSNVPT